MPEGVRMTEERGRTVQDAVYGLCYTVAAFGAYSTPVTDTDSAGQGYSRATNQRMLNLPLDFQGAVMMPI